VIVTTTEFVTGTVFAANVPVELPLAIVIVAGTVTTALLLFNPIVTALGAGVERVTVPVEVTPPVTCVGFIVTVSDSGLTVTT